MGLFDLFRRKKPVAPAPAPLTSEQLRDAIISAHARADAKRLAAIFNGYDQQIRRDCLGWNTVPEGLRDDRARVSEFIQAMGWLAETLKSSGDSRLYDLLVGNESDNPLLRWDALLNEAQELSEALEYDRAIQKLQDMLIDTAKLSGPGMERYVPLTHGQLGHTSFHCGRVELAKGHYETSLRLCREYDDVEGVRAYCASLYDLHRYQGDPNAAADYAAQAADACERLGATDDASRHRQQAAIVRAGEPPVRVVLTLGERQCELDDVRPEDLQEQAVRFHFVRNRPNLRKAAILTERGGKLGSEGKLYEALAEFRAAAEADAYDPQPLYEEAFTLMQLERHAEAAALYEEVETLAPGWFNCRSDGWVARHIAAGRWPHAAFAALMLEDMGPEQMESRGKLRIVDAALTAAPDLARLHLMRARTLETMGRRDDAAAACRAGLACCEDDDDVRTRLLLHLHMFLSDDGEQRDALKQAAALATTGNLIAAAMARVSLLARR